MSEAKNSVQTLLDVTRKTATIAAAAGEGISIADVAKIAQIRPLCLVSDNMGRIPEAYDIQLGILNYYAAIYLQGVSLLANGEVSSKLIKILDRTNPNRDLTTVITAYSNESYTNTISYNHSVGLQEDNGFTLSVSEEEYGFNHRRYVGLQGLEFGFRGSMKHESSMERFTHSLEETEDERRERHRQEDRRDRNRRDADEERRQNTANGTVKAKRLDVFEKSEKVIGKILEINFPVAGGQVVVIPTVITLDVAVIPSEILGDVISMNEDSITFGSRFKDAMSGRIRFFRDFLFCEDLIKQQKRTMYKDKSKAVASILANITKSQAMSLMTMDVSLNSVSSVMMITDEENNEMKKRLGGGMDNDTVRKMVFDNSRTMMIVVVEARYKTVSIYIRNYERPAIIPFSHFRSGGNEPDAITEMLRTMQMGNMPKF